MVFVLDWGYVLAFLVSYFFIHSLRPSNFKTITYSIFKFSFKPDDGDLRDVHVIIIFLVECDVSSNLLQNSWGLSPVNDRFSSPKAFRSLRMFSGTISGSYRIYSIFGIFNFLLLSGGLEGFKTIINTMKITATSSLTKKIWNKNHRRIKQERYGGTKYPADRSYSTNSCTDGCTHLRIARTAAVSFVQVCRRGSRMAWTAFWKISKPSHNGLLHTTSGIGLPLVKAERQYTIGTLDQAALAKWYIEPSQQRPGKPLQLRLFHPWKQAAAEPRSKFVGRLGIWLRLAATDVVWLS